jgi:hypothetical protein
MHPHWYSADPATQRKLISLFLHSSASTPSTATSSFQSELGYTRDPHDVASVLRWGLRHFLPGPPAPTSPSASASPSSPTTSAPSFGLSPAWYTIFHANERSSGYPARAYTDKLLPLLPAAHAPLLAAVLDVAAGLAAHAEACGMSGSKFAMVAGLWLLAAVPRARPDDDWAAFYARWERHGRMLEHLFLARIR